MVVVVVVFVVVIFVVVKRITVDVVEVVVGENMVQRCDFNLIGNANDKQGGSSNLSHSAKEFQEFMFDVELFDIPSKGLAYTWDIKRAGGANVRERIDRV
ncbi:hypothetical protein Tco_0712481 [Tanacetum coccineum]